MNYNEEIDYSSLDCYLTCPRKFLFRYVMNLVPTGPPSLDLIFGSAWHYGMEKAFEYIQANPGEQDHYLLTDIAATAFNQIWNHEAAQWFDADAAFPKNPGRAADMFFKFFRDHLGTLLSDGAEIVGVEQPFTIHLNTLSEGQHQYPNYIGKLDLVLLREGKSVEVIDHKTAKFANDTTFNGFTASMQTDGYLTAGHMFYDALPTITYYVALCQKTKIDFFAHQIARRKAAIDRFLDDLLARTVEIRNNLTLFEEEKHNQDKLYNPRCFRRKPGYACTLYFRKCEYYDICLSRNNPLLWHEEPPQGYEFKAWHPDNVSPAAILEKEGNNVSQG